MLTATVQLFCCDVQSLSLQGVELTIGNFFCIISQIFLPGGKHIWYLLICKIIKVTHDCNLGLEVSFKPMRPNMNVLDMHHQSSTHYRGQHPHNKTKKNRSICECVGDACNVIKQKLVSNWEWLLQAQADQYKNMSPQQYWIMSTRHYYDMQSKSI